MRGCDLLEETTTTHRTVGMVSTAHGTAADVGCTPRLVLGLPPIPKCAPSHPFRCVAAVPFRRPPPHIGEWAPRDNHHHNRLRIPFGDLPSADLHESSSPRNVICVTAAAQHRESMPFMPSRPPPPALRGASLVDVVSGNTDNALPTLIRKMLTNLNRKCFYNWNVGDI